MPRFLDFLAVVLLPLLASANTATITLFEVSQPAVTASRSESDDFRFTRMVSAIGPGSDGRTKYQEIEVISTQVAHLTDRTITLISTPITTIFTFEQDASHFIFHQSNAPQTMSDGFTLDSSTVQEECNLDSSKDTGSCVLSEEDIKPFTTTQSGGSVVTSTQTRLETVSSWTGPLVPFATVTVTSDGGSQQRYHKLYLLLSAVVGVLGRLLCV